MEKQDFTNMAVQAIRHCERDHGADIYKHKSSLIKRLAGALESYAHAIASTDVPANLMLVDRVQYEHSMKIKEGATEALDALINFNLQSHSIEEVKRIAESTGCKHLLTRVFRTEAEIKKG